MKMFKKHYDNMRPEPTPERVFAVSNLAAELNSSRAEIIKYTLLSNIFGNKHEDIVKQCINAAIELGVLEEKEGTIKLKANSKILNNYIGFRRFAAAAALSNNDTTFFKLTEWYLAQNEEIFKLRKWATAAATAVSRGISNITENDFLGWRFWVSFLGLGYLHNQVIIPNMYTRLLDTIELSKVKGNTQFTAKEFISWLHANCPETKKSCTIFSLNLGVSNGLRALHEQGKLEIIAQRDADRTGLYKIEGYHFNDFSHIIIKGENDYDMG
jgi:hypothetical protein